MTKQLTLHHPLTNQSLLTPSNYLFISNFQFSYHELLRELPREIISLFHSLIQDFQNEVEIFYEIINDEKKWDNLLRKYSHYRAKNNLFEQLFEEVCHFFEGHNSELFIAEIINYYSFASYTTQENNHWFLFDDYDGETIIPFTTERIVDGQMQFHDSNQKKVTLSPQAIMYIRLLDVALKNRILTFKIKADLDTDMPEYMQLLLYVCSTQEKANTYFISLKKPLTSLMEALISYHMLFRMLSDIHEKTENEEQKAKVMQYVLQLQPIFYRIASTTYLEFANEERKREEKAATNVRKKYEETTQKLEKQKAKYEELKRQQIETKKSHQEVVQPEQTISHTVMQEKTEQIKSLTEERNHLQRLITHLESSFRLDETKYQEEIERLKEENKGLQQKLQPLLKIANEPKIETVEQWLALGKTLIQHINETEEKEIRAFFELFLKICDEQKVAKPKQQLASNVFGYVSISSRGHHIHFPNGQDEMIEGLPANIYLADGQFVQVTKDFEYVQAYPDFYDFTVQDSTAQFSIVKMKADMPHVFFNNELVPLKHESHIHLREGQIVSFTAQHELIRFYKQQRFHLNLFEQSIALKEHTPYYVQKALPTGAVVTNVLTNAESFITFHNGANLQDDTFITVANDEIIRTFNGSFYKLSSYYTKTEIVSVCEIDGDCFGKKLNREVIIIRNIPTHISITLGDNVRIDEFNQYLEVVRDSHSESETLEQRLLRKPLTTVKESLQNISVAKTKSIVVVGNPSFFASYKQKLGEHGYNVTGIDGYESFSRIKQVAKDKDYIVVCIEFISHDNMYAIKDFYPSSKVIYSDRDGATQILLQLEKTAI